MPAGSVIVWVKWIHPLAGSEVGEIERLPRVVAEVFVGRGDAVEISEADVPPVVRRRWLG